MEPGAYQALVAGVFRVRTGELALRDQQRPRDDQRQHHFGRDDGNRVELGLGTA
jgi:hypothetical protein